MSKLENRIKKNIQHSTSNVQGGHWMARRKINEHPISNTQYPIANEDTAVGWDKRNGKQ
jgi:hypothetical protein